MARDIRRYLGSVVCLGLCLAVVAVCRAAENSAGPEIVPSPPPQLAPPLFPFTGATPVAPAAERSAVVAASAAEVIPAPAQAVPAAGLPQVSPPAAGGLPSGTAGAWGGPAAAANADPFGNPYAVLPSQPRSALPALVPPPAGPRAFAPPDRPVIRLLAETARRYGLPIAAVGQPLVPGGISVYRASPYGYRVQPYGSGANFAPPGTDAYRATSPYPTPYTAASPAGSGFASSLAAPPAAAPLSSATPSSVAAGQGEFVATPLPDVAPPAGRLPSPPVNVPPPPAPADGPREF